MTDRPTSSVWVGLDVVAGTAWLVLAGAAVLLPVPVPVRGLAVAPLLFVLPGYAVQMGLFAAGPVPSALERALLSVALSVAGTIAVGLALGATVGVTPLAALAALAALTLAGFATGVARDPDRAFALSNRSRAGIVSEFRSLLPLSAGSLLPAPTDPPDAETRPELGTVGAVVLLAGVAGLLATGFLLGVHHPPGGATLSLSPADGDWNGSTTAVGAGDPVRVSLAHSAPGPRSFVVVAVRQRPGETGPGQGRVLDRFAVTLAPDERWSRVHRPTVNVDGPVRLTYWLYRGTEAGGDPATNAHLWFGRKATNATRTTAGGPR